MEVNDSTKQAGWLTSFGRIPVVVITRDNFSFCGVPSQIDELLVPVRHSVGYQTLSRYFLPPDTSREIVANIFHWGKLRSPFPQLIDCCAWT
jgi:hypothetical protein